MISWLPLSLLHRMLNLFIEKGVGIKHHCTLRGDGFFTEIHTGKVTSASTPMVIHTIFRVVVIGSDLGGGWENVTRQTYFGCSLQ